MNDPVPVRWGRLHAVFGRRNYRRLWAARAVSQAGDMCAMVVLALLVFDLTG